MKDILGKMMKVNEQGEGEGYKVLHDDDKVQIVEITSKEAAIEMGEGTQWDVADSDENHFNMEYYDRYKNVYYVLPKDKNAMPLLVLVSKDGKQEVFDAENKPVEDRKAALAQYGLGEYAR